MDPLTHALASFTLQRAAFPRLSRSATIAVVLAGTIADADLLSTSFGPSAYLSFDRTYFHSLPAALVFALVATLRFFLKPKSTENPIPRPTIFPPAAPPAPLHPPPPFPNLPPSRLSALPPSALPPSAACPPPPPDPPHSPPRPPSPRFPPAGPPNSPAPAAKVLAADSAQLSLSSR